MKFKDMTKFIKTKYQETESHKIFEDGMKVRELVSDLKSAIIDSEENEQLIQIDYAIAELNRLKKELQ